MQRDPFLVSKAEAAMIDQSVVNQLLQTMGALGADVRNLSAQVGKMDDKVADLKTGQTSLKGRLDDLSQDVAEIKPSIAKFEATYQRGVGAKALVKLMWTVGVAAFTAAGYAVGHYWYLIRDTSLGRFL
jgi:hypothetical protein